MEKREANIDLLRIVSMLMIVILHALGKSCVLDEVEPFTLNYYLAYFFEGISYLGVNVFILISGYFADRSVFRSKKIVLLVLEVFFYSVVIYAIMLITGNVKFSLTDLPYVFLPVLSRNYWYITVYFCFYLLSPFLGANSLSNRVLNRLLILLFILFSVIPTTFFFVDTFDLNNGYSLLWFVFLYYTGLYIKRKKDEIVLTKRLVIIGIALILFIPLSRYLIAGATQLVLGKVVGAGFFFRYESVPVFCASVFLFILFTKLRINHPLVRKTIFFLSASTVSVYLIHTNKFVKDVFWSVFGFESLMDSPLLIPYVLAVSVLVFVVCILIDKCRAAAEKAIFRNDRFGKLFGKIDSFFSKENV